MSCALDAQRFSSNLRSARREAPAGASGLTTHHLRPVLDHPRHAFVAQDGRTGIHSSHPPRHSRHHPKIDCIEAARDSQVGWAVQQHNNSAKWWKQRVTSMPFLQEQGQCATFFRSCQMDPQTTIVWIDGWERPHALPLLIGSTQRVGGSPARGFSPRVTKFLLKWNASTEKSFCPS